MGNLNSSWLRRQHEELPGRASHDDTEPHSFASELASLAAQGGTSEQGEPHHTLPYELRRTFSRIRRRVALRRPSGNRVSLIGGLDATF